MKTSEKEKENYEKKVNIIYNVGILIVYKANFVDLMFSCTNCEEDCQIFNLQLNILGLA